MPTPLTFDVLARDKATKTFKDVGKAADDTGRKFGFLTARSKGLSAGLSLGFGKVATALAAVGAVTVFKGFVAEAREAGRVTRITESVIRSTGGAAKISADAVGTLAERLSNKTAIDDEVIQSGANLLLTFKNVRNEVGAGANIFDRATAAAVDLSAVGFGDVAGSSKMLGKALNDPIKGLTALGRAGVTFTDQQKKQIETLVKSGRVLEAQKIILQEVESQVGGAAAAAADPMKRLGVIVDNLVRERIGRALLPTVNRAAIWLGNNLPAAVDKSAVFFKTHLQPPLERFASYVKTDVIPRLVDFAGFVGKEVLPRVQKLGGWINRNRDFFGAWVKILGVVIIAVKTWTVVQGILNVVLAANPIGIVILALTGLAALLVTAYKRSTEFRRIVDTAFRIVAAAGKFMWDTVLRPMLILFGKTLQGLWGQAQMWARIMSQAFNAIKGPAVTVFRFVAGKMLDFIGTMLNGAAKAFGWVPKLGGPLQNAAKNFQTFRDSVNRSLDGIQDEPIDVRIGLKYTQALGQRTKTMTFAGGGGVRGPGGPTGDKIPALLSDNEHIWTAREVAAAGGHGAVERMRAAVLSGALRLATGGGVRLRPIFPSGQRLGNLTGHIGSMVGRVGNAIAGTVAKELAKSLMSPGLASTIAWAKTQAGKPYLWGGVGPRGYDCSGWVSALINRAMGRNPYRRLGATGSMPWSMFQSGRGAFMVGWFKGSPGHTAATINGINMESRGGEGVVIGSRARGANHPLFRNRMRVRGFARGGRVGDAAFDLLDPRGMSFLGADALRQLVPMHRFAKGGLLRERVLGVGLRSGRRYDLAENGAERVMPASHLRRPGGGDIHIHVKVEGLVADPIGTAQVIERLLARLKKIRRGRLEFVD